MIHPYFSGWQNRERMTEKLRGMLTPDYAIRDRIRREILAENPGLYVKQNRGSIELWWKPHSGDLPPHTIHEAMYHEFVCRVEG